MCESLQVFRPFGYSYALVDFLYNADKNFVWHLRCPNDSSDLREIRFVTELNKKKGGFVKLLSSLELYVADFLSLALNRTMKFIFYRKPDKLNKTDSADTIDGDVFLPEFTKTNIFNVLTKQLRPLSSPLTDFTYAAVMSLKNSNRHGLSDLIFVFDVQVYRTLSICVLLVSIFLHFCRLPSRLCKRPLLRQFFEMFLLISLQPRVFGLVKLKNQILRIIMTVSIMAGLLMRKTGGAQLNSIFTFETFDYVSDLGESLKSHPEIKTILTFNLKAVQRIKKSKSLGKYRVTTKQLFEESKILKDLLDGDKIVLFTEDFLRLLKSKYSFVPAVVTKLEKKEDVKVPVVYFPLYHRSPLYKEMFKALQMAAETGIVKHGFEENKMRFYHWSKAQNYVEDVRKLYQRNFSEKSPKTKKQANAVILSRAVLLSGLFCSSIFLFKEVFGFRILTLFV